MIKITILIYLLLITSVVSWRWDKGSPQIGLIVILVLEAFCLGFCQGFVAVP
jgi:hypothetical protein